MADKANSIGTVKYTKSGGTYFTQLITDFGDINQRYTSYDGNTNKATGVTPDFTVTGQQPTIEMYITNSKTTTSSGDSGEVYPNSASWEVNGTTLTFDSKGISTTTFNGESGHFIKIDADKSKSVRAGLKIVKNLVTAFNATSVDFVCLATIANGIGSRKETASYHLPVSQNTLGGFIVRISATNGGILDSEHSTTTLTVNIDDTGGGTVKNPTYKWEATDDNGDMQVLAGETGKTLKVDDKMVNNARLFKVTIDNVGSDVQTVYDHTDSLRIVPNPDPVTEDIADSSSLKVTWNPKLYRGENEVISTTASPITWNIKFYSPVGLPIEPKTKNTITGEEYDANGGVNYVISAQV